MSFLVEQTLLLMLSHAQASTLDLTHVTVSVNGSSIGKPISIIGSIEDTVLTNPTIRNICILASLVH